MLKLLQQYRLYFYLLPMVIDKAMSVQATTNTQSIQETGNIEMVLTENVIFQKSKYLDPGRY